MLNLTLIEAYGVLRKIDRNFATIRPLQDTRGK